MTTVERMLLGCITEAVRKIVDSVSILATPTNRESQSRLPSLQLESVVLASVEEFLGNALAPFRGRVLQWLLELVGVHSIKKIMGNRVVQEVL